MATHTTGEFSRRYSSKTNRTLLDPEDAFTKPWQYGRGIFAIYDLASGKSHATRNVLSTEALSNSADFITPQLAAPLETSLVLDPPPALNGHQVQVVGPLLGVAGRVRGNKQCFHNQSYVHLGAARNIRA